MRGEWFLQRLQATAHHLQCPDGPPRPPGGQGQNHRVSPRRGTGSVVPSSAGRFFHLPVIRGCRGRHHPDLPSGVFPVRRCCSIRNNAPSALPGSGCANTSRPAIPAPGRSWLSRRPWMYKRPSPPDPGTASALERSILLRVAICVGRRAFPSMNR